LWVLLTFDAIAVALLAFTPNAGRSIGQHGDGVPWPADGCVRRVLDPFNLSICCVRDLWRFIPDRGP
jgi:hypothetical protein